MRFTEERAVDYSVKEIIANIPKDKLSAICSYLRVDSLSEARVHTMYNGSSDVLTFFTLRSED